MSVKYCLPVPVFYFGKNITHPAARSLCDSWASCLFLFIVLVQLLLLFQLSTLHHIALHLHHLCVSGFLRSGKVREFSASQAKSGKVKENRGSGKSQGILKYHLLDQLFTHYFHNFCRLLGACPRPPPGLHPKHCNLVYIAIFYNGTKFSITFVYLVLFYWCRK